MAAVHFNHNLHRPIKTKTNDDAAQVRIVYPKFKNGEATVRDVKVKQNFGTRHYQFYNTMQYNTIRYMIW